MTEYERIQKLKTPEQTIHIVLDTDTGAEVDDQFAISYAIRSMEAGEIFLDAIYAAPFPYDWNNINPAKGMEASYQEILHVIDLCHSSLKIPAFRGSTRYMRDEGPIDSPAVQDLIRRGMACPSETPLYVVSIGAITNIGSALALEPRLAEHIVVIFLGGNSLDYAHVNEYNIGQDHGAFRAVVDSGVPLILFPARPCISHLLTSLDELSHYLKGKNEIADYLYTIVEKYCYRTKKPGETWSKVIWDIAGVTYLIHPEWFETTLEHTVNVTSDNHWILNYSDSLMRVVTFVRRDPVFTDVFRKLGKSR